MAITPANTDNDGIEEAVALAAATVLSFTEATTIRVSGFSARPSDDECAIVHTETRAGLYEVLTNLNGPVILGAYPNVVEVPPGNYKVTKTVTAANGYIGYGY